MDRRGLVYSLSHCIDGEVEMTPKEYDNHFSTYLVSMILCLFSVLLLVLLVINQPTNYLPISTDLVVQGDK